LRNTAPRAAAVVVALSTIYEYDLVAVIR